MGPLVREIGRSGRNLGGSLRLKRSNQKIQDKTFKPKGSSCVGVVNLARENASGIASDLAEVFDVPNSSGPL